MFSIILTVLLLITALDGGTLLRARNGWGYGKRPAFKSVRPHPVA